MNNTKKCSGAMTSGKNNLNSKISCLFKFEPNTHLESIWNPLILLKLEIFLAENTVDKGKS